MTLFPRQIHKAELPAGTFSWLEAGDATAPVALCLHGFPDHPRTFEPILEPLLAAGYRVVAPWLRGYAPSVTHGPYHSRQLGEDAIAVAREVSPGKPVLLIGHDWGAIAAWSAAARSSEPFAALVTISVPHPSAFIRNVRRHPQQLLRSWYVGAVQLPFLPERLIAARDFALIAKLYQATDGRLPPYWDDLRSTLRASMPGPLGTYRALRRHVSSPTKIHVPTLFLTGARDTAVGVEMSVGQERWIDAPFESAVLDTNHFVHHEQPDEVARRILTFAAKHKRD